jgi:hypothetical protein
MTDAVFLFHSTLQLIIAPSSEYSDQPNNGATDQNNPITIDTTLAIKTSIFQALRTISGSLIALYLNKISLFLIFKLLLIAFTHLVHEIKPKI